MTVFTFSSTAAVGGVSIAFSALTDRLDVDGFDAASAQIYQLGADLVVSDGTKSLTLLNTSRQQLSPGNIAFVPSGSRLLVGDATTGTAADGNGNALTGTASNDRLIGLGGNDTLNGAAGSDVYEIGGVADGFDRYADSGTSGIDKITATAGGTRIGLQSGFSAASSGIEEISANGFAGVAVQGGATNDSLSFSGIALTAISEIDGGAGNDTIVGSGLADTIRGGAGNDSLNGGEGGDTYFVTGSADGIDTILDTGTTPGDIDRLLAASAGTRFNLKSGFSSGSTGIEEISAGGHSDVQILGSTGSENWNFAATVLLGITAIDGGAGNDTITGSSTDDSIRGGLGNDSLNGGEGSDTYIVVGAADGIDTFADTGTGAGNIDSIAAGAAGTRINLKTGFSAASTGIENITGAGQNDVQILGSTAAENWSFAGVAISDIALIDGAGGNDTIFGSTSADTIRGGAGADSLDGGLGSDTYVVSGAGDGIDTYADSGSTIGDIDRIVATAAGTRVNLKSGFSASSGIEEITGNGHADVQILGGNAAENWNLSGIVLTGISMLDAGAGNDTVIGSAGADTIRVGAGNDSLNGGEGSDLYMVTGTGDGFDVFSDLGSTGIDRIVATAVGTRIGLASGFSPLSGIEEISANGLADVQIVGGSGNESLNLSGTILSDIAAIDGAAGNDTITGSVAADVLRGGVGTDSLNGGEAGDTYLVAGSAEGFDHYNDTGTTGFDRIAAVGAGTRIGLATGFSSARGIEEISGGTFGDVQILGSAGADNLSFAGVILSDIAQIDGGAGNDTLLGTAADDVIRGGAGNDSLNGGEGSDTFVFVGTTEGADAIVDSGSAGYDRIVARQDGTQIGLNGTFSATNGVEQISADGYANVSIIGGTGSDRLSFDAVSLDGIAAIDGALGNDTITATSGNDVIRGGAGNDSLVGGAGGDIAIFTGDRQDYGVTFRNDGSVVIQDLDILAGGNDGRDTLVGFEIARFADGDLIVGNTAPTAASDVGGVEEDTAVTLDVLGNDGDFEDGRPSLATYTDGGYGTVSRDDNNTAADLSDDRLVYTPNADFSGTDFFSYTITDSQGLSATTQAIVVVSPVNDTPIAVDDSVSVSEDAVSVLVPVTANDIDPDAGDTLSISGFDTTGTLGQVAAAGGGSVSYTPGAALQSLALGESVIDTFAYVAVDSSGSAATASVSITVTGANDAPVAALDSAAAAEDGVLTANGNLLLNDTDVDHGSSISVSAVSTGTRLGTYGTLSIDVAGEFLYTLNNAAPGVQSLRAGQVVSDGFAYAVTDEHGALTAGLLSIAVSGANDMPTAILLSGGVVAENSLAGTTVGTLATVDLDQGDTHTYTLLDDAGGRFVLDGATVRVASGADLDFEATISHQIIVHSTDAGGGSVDQALTIHLSNEIEPVALLALNAAPGSAGHSISLVSADAAGQQGNFGGFQASISADGRYVAFSSFSSNLVEGDTNNASDIFVKDLATGAVTRVSTDAAGQQGNLASYDPSISADGRYVAFSSESTNLVEGDTNNASDIFVKDLVTGVVTPVSTNAAGQQGNVGGYGPSISADGRYVAFSSESTNLVEGDTNNRTDIFVKDLATAAVVRVSTGAAGQQANFGGYEPSISADGRYVAFFSDSTNLVEGDTNNRTDIFVKDLATGAVTRVSTDAAGQQANVGARGTSSISADGRYVAFSSDSNNLVDGDTDNILDVFVKDLATGSVTHVSTGAAGQEGVVSGQDPFISADGRYVAFSSGSANNPLDVFVKDLATGTVTRVSNAGAGQQGNGESANLSLSADGRYVAFSSQSSNLVEGDTNNWTDIFVASTGSGYLGPDAVGVTLSGAFTVQRGGHHVEVSWGDGLSTGRSLADGMSTFSEGHRFGPGSYTATVTITNSDGSTDSRSLGIGVASEGSTLSRMNVSASGGQSAAGADSGNLSADGRYALFQSAASDLIVRPDLTGSHEQVYVKDQVTGAVRLVSETAAGEAGNGASGGYISGDGTYAVFHTLSTNFDAGDPAGTWDIYRKNLVTGALELVTVTDAGERANASSLVDSVSADGDLIVFQSVANNLTAGDTNNGADVFLKNMLTGEITRISTAQGMPEPTSGIGSFDGSISADGKFVAFSGDVALTAADGNTIRDIYLYDVGAAALSLITAGADGVSDDASLSADGRYVTFRSDASNLVAGDVNGVSDVFRKDLQTGEIELVSLNGSGEQGNAASVYSGISADGRYVLFGSAASNLVEGDDNGVIDIFLRDMVLDTVTRVSTNAAGEDGNATSNDFPALSADGRFALFQSDASNLVPGDTNNAQDVFVADFGSEGATLTGTSSPDYLIGQNGADSLFGSGGDTLAGGDGNDVIETVSLLAMIEGGLGSDRLVLDDAGLDIDLLALPAGQIEGIEMIDLRGAHANSLLLDEATVADLSFETWTLMVYGDADDSVASDDIWALSGIELADGLIFEAFTSPQATARLLVQQGVDTLGLVG